MAGLDQAYAAGNRRGASVPEFAESLGLSKGVTGYIYHTVPVAIYAWLRHYGDFRATIEAALDCGGDTDTVGESPGRWRGQRSANLEFPISGYVALSTGHARSVYFARLPSGLVSSTLKPARLAKSPISGPRSCREMSSFSWSFSCTDFAVWLRRTKKPDSRGAGVSPARTAAGTAAPRQVLAELLQPRQVARVPHLVENPTQRLNRRFRLSTFNTGHLAPDEPSAIGTIVAVFCVLLYTKLEMAGGRAGRPREAAEMRPTPARGGLHGTRRAIGCKLL